MIEGERRSSINILWDPRWHDFFKKGFKRRKLLEILSAESVFPLVKRKKNLPVIYFSLDFFYRGETSGLSPTAGCNGVVVWNPTLFSIIIIIFTPRLLSVYSILWKLIKKRLLKSISGGEKRKKKISCCVPIPKKRAIEYHRRSVWVLRRGGRSFGMRSNESLNKKKGDL